MYLLRVLFRTYLGTFWRTILTSIITWYNYIFTYLPKYEIERIIEQSDVRFWIPLNLQRIQYYDTRKHF